MAQHNDLGTWGEKLAREYLIARGYSVFDSNIHIGHKEIDIIATKGDHIMFIEVKTRSTPFKDPLDAVDKKKIKLLAAAADSFMQAYNVRHEPQFDIITVIGRPETGYEITHYPDAFLPPLTGAW